LYALQAAYSSDVGFAARNVGFFLVPFAATFVLLCEARWTPSLLRAALFVVVAEASLFAIVGVGQFALGEIFWNPALERSNDFHFYFRVNSLFWDPNIYGRYLALAAVLVAAVLIWSKDVRRIGLCAAALALLLAGLTFGFSQTSFISLLVGVTVLVALRWSALWTAVAAPAAAAVVVAIVIFVGATSAAEDSPSELSSGRTTLIEGGWKLARERPMLGHGSASFSEAFAEQEEISPNKTTVSHNEPVTVAAEQGLLGLLAYALLLAAAFWTLLAGMRRIAPGLGAPRDAIGDEGADAVIALARIALAGGFAALVIHTIGYAGYLTDPLTWALLAVAASLAAVPASRTGPAGPAS
ncbi:MAG: O-antigen ligase family protein, partial [Actinomycetota bacterium]|nr:O-antigen ligase family protein [Actinomycetota bacterium]